MSSHQQLISDFQRKLLRKLCLRDGTACVCSLYFITLNPLISIIFDRDPGLQEVCKNWLLVQMNNTTKGKTKL